MVRILKVENIDALPVPLDSQTPGQEGRLAIDGHNALSGHFSPTFHWTPVITAAATPTSSQGQAWPARS